MYKASKLRPIISADLLRLGHDLDGGYVINQRVMDRSGILITFGISGDWTFESDFYKRKKGQPFKIEAYDFSVDFKQFLRTSFRLFLQIFEFKQGLTKLLYSLYYIKLAFKFYAFFNRKNIKFYKKGIDDHNNGVFIDFKTVFDNLGAKQIDEEVFIKMDIEGYEFKVANQMLAHADRISGIIIEFHDLDKNGDLFEAIIDLFHEKGFVITHVHPNNWGGVIEHTNLPRLIEITFAKRAFFSSSELSAHNDLTYPRPELDYPCVKYLPELMMQFDS